MRIRGKTLYIFFLNVTIPIIILTILYLLLNRVEMLVEEKNKAENLQKKWTSIKYTYYLIKSTSLAPDKSKKIEQLVADFSKKLNTFLLTYQPPHPPTEWIIIPNLKRSNPLLQIQIQNTRKRWQNIKNTILSTVNQESSEKASLMTEREIEGFDLFESLLFSYASEIKRHYRIMIRLYKRLFLSLGILLTLLLFASLLSSKFHLLNKKLLLHTINSLEEGIVITDSKDRILIANQTASRLFSRRNIKYRKTPVQEVFQIVNEYTGKRVDLFPHEETQNFSTAILTKEGKKIPVAVIRREILTHEKEITGSVYIIKNLSKWQRLISKFSFNSFTQEFREIDREIEKTLRHIVTIAGYDEGYIYQLLEKEKIIKITHSSTNRRGTKITKVIHTDAIPILMDKLLSQSYTRLNTTRLTINKPPLNEEIQRNLKPHKNLREIVAIPLRYMGSTIGFLFMISKRTNFPAMLNENLVEFARELIINLFERKWSTAQLIAMASDMELLIENANAPIWGLDHRLKINIWNNTMSTISGYTKSEAIIQNPTFFVEPENREKYMRVINQSLKGKRLTDIELKIRSKEGKKRVLLVNTSPRFDLDGKINGMLIIGQDITKRNIAEQQIRTLTQQLMTLQETEHQRIAMDLHDDIAQRVLSSKMQLDILINRINAHIPENRMFLKQLNEISQSLRETIGEIKNIAYNLRPPYLDQLGLDKAVQQLCKETAKKGNISIKLLTEGFKDIKIEPEKSIHVYRIIQEILSNILTHSGATEATFKMKLDPSTLNIEIEDNGIGFDVENIWNGASEKHTGLKNIEERLKILEGNSQILSQPGRGTKIHLRIPIQQTGRENV